MALVLKQIFTSGSDEIAQNYAIESWHVSQSVDAFTGAVAYDITISGSLTLTGSVNSRNGFTGSVLGTSSWATSSSAAISSSRAVSALNADTIDIDNVVSTNQGFLVAFVTKDSSYPASRAINVDSGSDGSGLWYNPSNNSLTASYFAGTASFAVSASVATSASYAENATNITYTYVGVDDVTYSSSAVPFPVQGNTPSQIYISQSGLPPTNQLALQFGTGNNGQIVNFTPTYKAAALALANINLTSSSNIFGLNGTTVSSGSAIKAEALLTGITPTLNNLTFQYINVSVPSTIFPASGWYLINVNQS
jgi:hypothetical protein